MTDYGRRDCQKDSTPSVGWWTSTGWPNSEPPANQSATAPPTEVVSRGSGPGQVLAF